MRARATPTILIATAPLLACAAPHPPAAELCVERLENNGFVNIVAVDLVVDGTPVMTLTGGERQCVPLKTGSHGLQLKWRWDPRDPDPALVQSAVTSIELTAEGAAREICLDEGAPYPSWKLARVGTSSMGSCGA